MKRSLLFTDARRRVDTEREELGRRLKELSDRCKENFGKADPEYWRRAELASKRLAEAERFLATVEQTRDRSA
jgi:hypothetical protein